MYPLYYYLTGPDLKPDIVHLPGTFSYNMLATGVFLVGISGLKI
jgi:hypothetical protein